LFVKKYKEMVFNLHSPSLSYILDKKYIPNETKTYIRRILASSIVFEKDLVLELNSSDTTNFATKKNKYN